MANSSMFGRIFSLLICVGSVLCSNYSTDDSRDYVVFENFPGNEIKRYYMFEGIGLHKTYEMIADAIENFEVRDDDVWICTFARSGTTWTQEMVWMIVHDLDFDGAKLPLKQRSPFLERIAMEIRPNMSAEDVAKTVENIAKMPSPRIIKTHLPLQLLPRQLRERETKAKIVHVSRDAKDVSVSYYHFYKRSAGYLGTLEDFSHAFMESRLMFTPYWGHVNGYLERRGDESMLFLTFEDMKTDLPSQIQKVSEFLGKELNYTQIMTLERHLNFKSMRKNPAVNQEDLDAFMCKEKPCEEKFMRSGEVGQWKTAMSEELIGQLDDWIKENSKEH